MRPGIGGNKAEIRAWSCCREAKNEGEEKDGMGWDGIGVDGRME